MKGFFSLGLSPLVPAPSPERPSDRGGRQGDLHRRPRGNEARNKGPPGIHKVLETRHDTDRDRLEKKCDLFSSFRYLVSVQVVNPEGLGPAATVEVTTDEGGRDKKNVFLFLKTK